MDYENYGFDEQTLYLSGLYLYGVQSVTTEFTYPSKYPLSLGVETPVARTEEGNIKGELFVSRLITTRSDPVTGFFPNGVSGHLSYADDRAYIFETGLIKDYSCEVEVGELPTLDFTLETWGKTATSYPGGELEPGSETKTEEELFLPTAGDIEIHIEDCAGGNTLNASSNAVRQFAVNSNIEWEPINTLGNLQPAGFYAKAPLELNCTVQFEVNNYSSPNFEESLCLPILKNITVSIYSCSEACAQDRVLIRSLRVPSAQLVGYNQFSDINGVLIGEALFESVNIPLDQMGVVLAGK